MMAWALESIGSLHEVGGIERTLIMEWIRRKGIGTEALKVSEKKQIVMLGGRGF